MNKLGETIRSRRKDFCLTLEGLATRCGTSQPTLSRIENGEVPLGTISAWLLRELGRHLDIPYWELMELLDEDYKANSQGPKEKKV